MAKYKRVNEKTPNGGDYSKIYYFNDEKDATRCVIRESKNDGTLICEIWGVSPNKDKRKRRRL